MSLFKPNHREEDPRERSVRTANEYIERGRADNDPNIASLHKARLEATREKLRRHFQ